MKINQRLGYQRLAEELVDRDLIEREAARQILQQGVTGGRPFPIALVEADLVTDWELSRIVCELYNLPFLTVDIARPSARALEGLDPFFFMQHHLVPLCRHARVLTVLMPAMVPAEVLAQLSRDSGFTILPVVGTVRTNQEWIAENLAQYADAPVDMGPQWSALFDEADAAVLNALEDEGSSVEPYTGGSIPFDGGGSRDGQAA